MMENNANKPTASHGPATPESNNLPIGRPSSGSAFIKPKGYSGSKDIQFTESSVLVRGETPTAAITKADMEQLAQNRGNAMQHYKEKKKYRRHSTDREVALMMLMAYLSYLLAELFYLSAILTVFFCGIEMSHYTWHNVTESSRITTKHAFATLSFVCEIFIFLYVGMDALDMEKWRFVNGSPGTSVGVSSILLGLILVGRAAFVFPLSFIANLTRKSPHEKIDIKRLRFGGLVL